MLGDVAHRQLPRATHPSKANTLPLARAILERRGGLEAELSEGREGGGRDRAVGKAVMKMQAAAMRRGEMIFRKS